MGFFKKITQFGAPGLFRSAKNTFGGGGGYGDIPQYQQGSNPSEFAMPYLNEIPGTVSPYYQPFIQGGQEAQGQANPQYSQMAQDPGAFIERLMSGYTPSRGYQFKQREMEKALRSEAAHGGFLGTPYAQQQQGELVQGLLGQDMQQFLENLMGAQGRGLGGLENRIGRGYESSHGLGNILGSVLGTKAGLGFQGQAQQNQLGADIFSNRINAQNAMRQSQDARRNARMNFFGNLLGTGLSAMTGGFGR